MVSVAIPYRSAKFRVDIGLLRIVRAQAGNDSYGRGVRIFGQHGGFVVGGLHRFNR